MTREQRLPNSKQPLRRSLPQRDGRSRAESSFTEAGDRPGKRLRRRPQGFLQRLYLSLIQLIRRIREFLTRLFTNWKFLIFLGLSTTLAAGGLATAFIFQLPALPNCPAVFWPLASASMRFECARIAASKQTADDLLEAIALVDGLPPDHAMRAEADRMIELWSQEVLKLAEELFQKGKLQDAITAARKIPAKVTAYRLVEERVKRWETIWAKAEEIYRKVEAALRKRDWREAFHTATRLLDVDNRFWQTTQYDDLNRRINTARDEGNKLYKAENLADAGGLDNILAALKLAEEIPKGSYVYELAQQKIQGFGRKLLDLAQAAVDRRNLQEALEIANKIPKSARLEQQVKDFTVLANAQSQTWQDTVVGLEEAIAQAQRLRPDRPLYQKAQQMIARWQYEIEGLAQIERARTVAQGGTVESLMMAIATASQVSSANPRWGEAQKQIQQWRSQVETIQDQPLLDQADQYASVGDLNSLQAAIAQASQIGSGRALYGQAQSRIRQWTNQIETAQDQPYLDQAQAYASMGNVRAAINTAQQVRPGRALYDQAQKDVAQWQSQIQAEETRAKAQLAEAQAQQTLQQARQLASPGNPTAIANAVRIASQISGAGTVQTEVNAAINEWSWQLLTIAKEQAAGLNVEGAIAIAQTIPSRAEAYKEAQAQIETWKKAKSL